MINIYWSVLEHIHNSFGNLYLIIILEYNQQSDAAVGSQPQLIHQPTPIHHTTGQIPPQTILPQQVPPVTAASLLQGQFPQGFPQGTPAAFLQAGVAPPTFIPPQPPQIINYVQSQPTFTANYQGYQQQFNPVVSFNYFGLEAF